MRGTVPILHAVCGALVAASPINVPPVKDCPIGPTVWLPRGDVWKVVSVSDALREESDCSAAVLLP